MKCILNIEFYLHIVEYVLKSTSHVKYVHLSCNFLNIGQYLIRLISQHV